MPTEEYKAAKAKWLEAKSNYDDTIVLLDTIFRLLEFNHAELNRTFSEFSLQQSKQVHKSNIKTVKE
jgi:hypothetical protein